MRIGILIDSACDLPKDFLDAHDVRIMPITLRIGDLLLEDRRDPVATQAFYARQLDNKGEDYAESIPYSVEKIKQLFLEQLVLDFDYVFCLTITSTRSAIFDNAMQASRSILTQYKAIRREAGIPERFGLAVLSTRNLFTGQAVPVVEVVRMIRQGGTPSEIGERLQSLINQTHAYLVPADLFYIYKRASKKGDSSLSWGSYTLGSWLDVKPIIHCNQDVTDTVDRVRGYEAAVEKMFSMATRRVQAGLLAPCVCLSYGGDLEVVSRMPGYQQLAQAVADNGATLLLAPMSTTTVINVGPGALALGLAAKEGMH